MKCKKCGCEVEHEGEDLCNFCSSLKMYADEYAKDMASIYRAEHFSAKQTEDYWKKR